MVVTNKQSYNARYKLPKDTSHSRAEIARRTGIPSRILTEEHDTGQGIKKI